MTIVNLTGLQPPSVSNLSITSLGYYSVKLTWTRASSTIPSFTEVWRADNNDRNDITFIRLTTTSETSFIDNISGQFVLFNDFETNTTQSTFYYWIREVNEAGDTYSDWYPLSSTGGVLGTFTVIDTPNIISNSISRITFINTSTPLILSTYDDKIPLLTYTLTGDGYKYIISSNIDYSTTTTINVNNTDVELNTISGVINATQAALIHNQTEVNFDGVGGNGTFVGGVDYNVNDTITLEDGSIITVNSVSFGNITGFTITTVNIGINYYDIYIRKQTSTSGIGSGFILQPSTNNMNNESLAIPFNRINQSRFAQVLNNDFSFWGFTPYNTFPITLNINERYNFYILGQKTRSDATNILDVTAQYRFISLLQLRR